MSARILVVEDNAALARPLVRLLARSGYIVEHAQTCKMAEDLGGGFDIALLDLDLPDGLGVDLYRSLVSSGKIARGLFYTGSIDSALINQARALAPVVRKSEGVEALMRAITASLSTLPREAVGDRPWTSHRRDRRDPD